MSTSDRLGVQLYSVRDDIDPASIGRTFDRLAGMGFTHVEPYDILNDTEGLESALTAAGLHALTAHAKITELDPAAVLDAAERLGIETVLVPMVPPASIADRSGVERLAEAINRASALAQSRGLHVGYHNHDFEFSQHIDGTSAYEILVSLLDPAVVLEVDTYWASVGGADVFELIPRLSDRVRFLHVRNQPDRDAERPILGVPVTGRQGELLALAAAHLVLPVVEVVVHEGDVFPILEQNARFFAGELAL